MEFNINLKNLRIAQNLYQKDIAKKLNISTDTYGAWERGNNEPSIDIIKKLANLFNVSIDYLLGNEEEDGRIIVQELELPSDEKKVLEKYRILPPELKAVSYEYIKSLGNLNEEFDIKRKRNL